MRFYNKWWASCYDELIAQYPRFYRDVYEMVEILKAFGRVSDRMESDIEQTYLNNFILEADEATIKEWEDIIGITYSEKLSLENRRRVVVSRLIGIRHIGEPEIREIVAQYSEGAVEVDFEGGVITLIIYDDVFDEDVLRGTLLERIPAHLRLDMRVKIPREFRQVIKFSFGGTVQRAVYSDWISEDRSSAGTVKAGAAGGAYCYSSVKSKLIE